MRNIVVVNIADKKKFDKIGEHLRKAKSANNSAKNYSGTLKWLTEYDSVHNEISAQEVKVEHIEGSEDNLYMWLDSGYIHKMIERQRRIHIFLCLAPNHRFCYDCSYNPSNVDKAINDIIKNCPSSQNRINTAYYHDLKPDVKINLFPTNMDCINYEIMS